MSYARLQSAQSICCRRRAPWMKRRFVSVNVEMIGERVPGVQFQNSIQRRENFVGTGSGLTLRRPLIPRTQVHHRFGEEYTHVWIIWIFLPNRAHGVGISLIERRAVLRLRICIAMTESFDQIAFNRRRVFCILLGELEFFPRQLRRWWWHRGKVDVGPASQCDSPMCHRAFRVELCRCLKRTNGRAMVESMHERQSLIEVPLCFGRI